MGPDPFAPVTVSACGCALRDRCGLGASLSWVESVGATCKQLIANRLERCYITSPDPVEALGAGPACHVLAASRCCARFDRAPRCNATARAGTETVGRFRRHHLPRSHGCCASHSMVRRPRLGTAPMRIPYANSTSPRFDRHHDIGSTLDSEPNRSTAEQFALEADAEPSTPFAKAESQRERA